LKYVMVTTWPNHWDRVGNKSSFSYSMLKGGVMDPSRIVNHTPAVFIRIDKETKLPRKCWEGELLVSKRTSDKVWFEFRLDGEIHCPQQYVGFPEGWFTDEAN
jgi:hypothetical protein